MNRAAPDRNPTRQNAIHATRPIATVCSPDVFVRLKAQELRIQIMLRALTVASARKNRVVRGSRRRGFAGLPRICQRALAAQNMKRRQHSFRTARRIRRQQGHLLSNQYVR